jgi:hypothetical protein
MKGTNCCARYIRPHLTHVYCAAVVSCSSGHVHQFVVSMATQLSDNPPIKWTGILYFVHSAISLNHKATKRRCDRLCFYQSNIVEKFPTLG